MGLVQPVTVISMDILKGQSDISKNMCGNRIFIFSVFLAVCNGVRRI